MTFTAPAFKAVLFDLDGTLIDSAPDLGAAAEHMRASRGLPPLGLAAYRHMAGAGARGLLSVAFNIEPTHPDFESFKDEFLNRYEQLLAVHTVAFEGVEATLNALQSAGIAWGIVTNKHERFTLPLVAKMPVLTQAQTVVCGDTTPHAKPHPAPLLEAAKQLGLPPNSCVYVGDDERDIIAAHAAGMYSIAAQYGYLGTKKIDEWGAKSIISTPKELLLHLNIT
jgi:phosphoglycolate phosphatase